MPFTLNGLPDYDALIYEVLHESMDHLIDLGARCNAHKDVLDIDEEDDQEDGPHPLKVLKAQLQIDGAEDEVQEVQHLIQITSQLLITRHTRRVTYANLVSGNHLSDFNSATRPSIRGPKGIQLSAEVEDSQCVSDDSGGGAEGGS